MIRAFVQNKLRIIDENSNFAEREEEQCNITVFNEDMKLAIKRNEDATVTDESVKDGIMV